MSTRTHDLIAAARALAVGVGLVLVTPSGAAAQEPAGTVVVIDAEDGAPLEAGGSDTAFRVQLPDGAACPGDSEEGQYRVQSFLVPVDADPGALRYEGLHPQTEDGWALYETNTNTFVNRPTDRADEPGGEGRIVNLPPFSFAVFEPGLLPPGRYHLGVACSLFGETELHWSTEVAIDADADEPAGISWTVVDPPAVDGARTGGSTRILIALTAVGIAGVVLVRRRPVHHNGSVTP